MKIVKERNAVGGFLLRRDGHIVKMCFPHEDHFETVSIMLATVYGAAYTSTMHLRGESPKRVEIECESFRIEVMPVEMGRILVLLFEK